MTFRLGSCGGLVDVPPGTVVVPRACVAVTRNVDYDFHNPEANTEKAYRISKPVCPSLLLVLISYLIVMKGGG